MAIVKDIEIIAQKYAELIRKEINLKTVYLYGSFAKGNNNEDSDIDIAVVADDFTGDPVEDRLKLMRIRRKVDTRIEPHPFCSSDFKLSNPFVREIIETGIKIM